MDTIRDSDDDLQSGRLVQDAERQARWEAQERAASAATRDIADVPAVEVITTASVHLMSAAAVKVGLADDPSAQIDLDEARIVLRDSLQTVFPPLGKYFYPLPGALVFLEWAKTRYTLLLATNPIWPREIIELRVRWAGIDPAIFNFITDVHVMSAFKPDPKYFREILKHEGLKPEQCLFIGNETRMDLPATRVGIPVYIVTKSGRLDHFKQPKSRAVAAKGTFKQLRLALEAAPLRRG